MTQNATQAKKSRSFTVGVSFQLSSYYSLSLSCKFRTTHFFLGNMGLFRPAPVGIELRATWRDSKRCLKTIPTNFLFTMCKIIIKKNCWNHISHRKCRCIKIRMYLPYIKVVLVLCKVAWADTCVVIVTTQGSAHASLRSTRKTLVPFVLNATELFNSHLT